MNETMTAYRDAAEAWIKLEDYIAKTPKNRFSIQRYDDLDLSMRLKMEVARNCLIKEDEDEENQGAPDTEGDPEGTPRPPEG